MAVSFLLRDSTTAPSREFPGFNAK